MMTRIVRIASTISNGERVLYSHPDNECLRWRCANASRHVLLHSKSICEVFCISCVNEYNLKRAESQWLLLLAV